jgi:hypothetical protein
VPKVADEGVVIGTEKKKCPGREVGTTATGAGFICVRDSEFSAPALAAVVPLAERQKSVRVERVSTKPGRPWLWRAGASNVVPFVALLHGPGILRRRVAGYNFDLAGLWIDPHTGYTQSRCGYGFDRPSRLSAENWMERGS